MTYSARVGATSLASDEEATDMGDKSPKQKSKSSQQKKTVKDQQQRDKNAKSAPKFDGKK
jgi:hypothetical protein